MQMGHLSLYINLGSSISPGICAFSSAFLARGVYGLIIQVLWLQKYSCHIQRLFPD